MKAISNRRRIHSLVLTMVVLGAMHLEAMGTAFAGAEAADRIQSAIEQTHLSSGDRADLLKASNRAINAGVPAEDVAIIITRGAERRIDAKNTRELIDTATTVQEQGLPVRPVLNRIQQGLAKGAPAERISAASKALANRMAEAQPIVDGLAKGGVQAGSGRDREYAVETVARALEKSIPSEAIVSTGSRVGEHKGSVMLFDKAVRTMTNLTDSGVSSEAATRIVHEAVKHGYTEKDLGRLERDVAEDVRKGRSGEDAGKSRESEIRSGRDHERDSGREKVRERDKEREKVRDKDHERDGGRSGKN